MRFDRFTAILATCLLASCSGSKPDANSALAKQLVGHWTTRSDDHLYFGKANAANNMGSYVLVHPDGKAFDHRYELKSEDAGTRTLVIDLKFKSGDSRETTYIFSSDGKSAETETNIDGIETKSRLSKVDDATSP